jgi:nitroimidazol reductase NimA-like FMN-containing flavoprotein (pyridoxamine 5'-phosphate oxidase superfamily)
MAKFPVTPLNEVKRGARKASYDKDTVYQILDASEVCHIAFLYEGRAMVLPINFGRKGDKIYLHGSHHNRMTQSIIDTGEVTLNVMLLDAMKLTRSAFHHSVNYRSVTVFGKVREMMTHEEKEEGLQYIINHFVPNRWENCRKPTLGELDGTRVVEITIETASAKVANEPPKDNTSDLDLEFWAGTIPVKRHYDLPIPDIHLEKNTPIPKHVKDFIERKNQ